MSPCLSNKQQGRALPHGARPSCKGRALLQRGALQSNQHLPTSPYFNQTLPLHPTWPGNLLIYLHHQLIHPPPPPYQGHGGTTYPSTPFGMESSIATSWPRYGLLTTSRAVTMNHNGRYLRSGIDLTVKKSASKSSAVPVEEGGILYRPA